MFVIVKKSQGVVKETCAPVKEIKDLLITKGNKGEAIVEKVKGEATTKYKWIDKERLWRPMK